MEINRHKALCLWRTHWCDIWWWGRFFNWHVVAVAMARFVLRGRKSGTLGNLLWIWVGVCGWSPRTPPHSYTRPSETQDPFIYFPYRKLTPFIYYFSHFIENLPHSYTIFQISPIHILFGWKRYPIDILLMWKSYPFIYWEAWKVYPTQIHSKMLWIWVGVCGWSPRTPPHSYTRPSETQDPFIYFPYRKLTPFIYYFSHFIENLPHSYTIFQISPIHILFGWKRYPIDILLIWKSYPFIYWEAWKVYPIPAAHLYIPL